MVDGMDPPASTLLMVNQDDGGVIDAERFRMRCCHCDEGQRIVLMLSEE
jgi:hypothetical protein